MVQFLLGFLYLAQSMLESFLTRFYGVVLVSHFHVLFSLFFSGFSGFLPLW